ncbi:MAG: ABC transporter ATP-binding protein [Desulfosoma sp.]
MDVLMSSSTPLYELDRVVHIYDDRPVLSIERWSMAPGVVLGLVGPNGSGKSTLLRLLGFVEFPVRGSISFQGQRVSRNNAPHFRQVVTLLPQNPYLLDRTVADNVAYGLSVRGIHRDRTARVAEALRWVGLLPEVFGPRSVRSLSGGEARRVALAARLVLRPHVLLLDEPTAEIDMETAYLLRQAALKARAVWGTTVVMTSHDWGWLLGVCDEIHQMHGGRLLGRAPMNLFEGPWNDAGVPGKVWKDLGGGLKLMLALNRSRGATAVVPSEHVSLFKSLPESLKDRPNVFQGIITELALHGRNDLILVTVRLAERSLLASVSKDRVSAEGLQLGTPVWAWIPEDQCRWV